MAQRLDLVAEQLGAHRRGRAGRVDVEDAAADRELARGLGGLDALVAHAREARDRLLEVELAAGGEHERVEDVAALRRHGAHERARRGDDDLVAALVEREERLSAGAATARSGAPSVHGRSVRSGRCSTRSRSSSAAV